MDEFNPVFIGTITIKALRDFILDNDITEADTLILTPADYGAIATEHYNTFKDRLPSPHFLTRVMIKENEGTPFPDGRVGIIVNDDRPSQSDYEDQLKEKFDKNEHIYRCGWCGNIVDQDGQQVTAAVRAHKIWLHSRVSNDNVHRVDGYCCPNGHNN